MWWREWKKREDMKNPVDMKKPFHLQAGSKQPDDLRAESPQPSPILLRAIKWHVFTGCPSLNYTKNLMSSCSYSCLINRVNFDGHWTITLIINGFPRSWWVRWLWFKVKNLVAFFFSFCRSFDSQSKIYGLLMKLVWFQHILLRVLLTNKIVILCPSLSKFADIVLYLPG